MLFSQENLEDLERQLILLGYLDYKTIIATSVKAASPDHQETMATMQFTDKGTLAIENLFTLKNSENSWTLQMTNATAECKLPFVQNNNCVVNGVYHLQNGQINNRNEIKMDLHNKLAALVISQNPALKEEFVKLGFEEEMDKVLFKSNSDNVAEFEIRIKVPGTSEQVTHDIHFVINASIDHTNKNAFIERVNVTRYSYWNIEDGGVFIRQNRLPTKGEIVNSRSLYLLSHSIGQAGMNNKTLLQHEQQENIKNTTPSAKRKL
jgi:hypothetical protein